MGGRGGATDWFAAAALNIVKSLLLAAQSSFRIPNFLDISATFKIIKPEPQMANLQIYLTS